MGLSISEIRQNTTRARHLMQRTRAQHFAVGAFNIDNQETLIAVARAAQKLQSPVLVEVSDAEVKAMGLENVRDLVDNYKTEYGIEMYLNLDHEPLTLAMSLCTLTFPRQITMLPTRKSSPKLARSWSTLNLPAHW